MKQSLYVPERESRVLRDVDDSQALKDSSVVAPPPTGSLRRWKQALALVVADRRWRDAGGPCDVADRERWLGAVRRDGHRA